MSSEEPDREGMFTHPRLVGGKSVVTCTRCGATVDDTDAHACDPTRAEDPIWQDY